MAKRNISLVELCDSITEECQVFGAKDRYVSIASPIDKSNRESVTFCSRNTIDALPAIRDSKAGVIICSKELTYKEGDYKDKTLILVANPRLAFIEVMQKYFQEEVKFGIHPTAIIDKDARVPPNVCIGANSCIGKCEIGENTIIHANVHIYSQVKIGRNVTIYDGTVIGKEGFGYEKNSQGKWVKFPHIGGVIIEDDVEIGSNVTIDRGTLDNTIIGQGTKIDNLCHIAHNVVIGKNCSITAHSCFAGSSKMGDDSWLAPGVIVRDGIKIGSNVIIGMGSVVTKNIEDNCFALGIPARVVRRQDNSKENDEN